MLHLSTSERLLSPSKLFLGISKRLLVYLNAVFDNPKASLRYFKVALEYFRAAFAYFNAVFGFLNIVSHVRHEANGHCPPACDRKVAAALAFCCKTAQAITSIKQELQKTSTSFPNTLIRQEPYGKWS